MMYQKPICYGDDGKNFRQGELLYTRELNIKRTKLNEKIQNCHFEDEEFHLIKMQSFRKQCIVTSQRTEANGALMTRKTFVSKSLWKKLKPGSDSETFPLHISSLFRNSA